MRKRVSRLALANTLREKFSGEKHERIWKWDRTTIRDTVAMKVHRKTIATCYV